MSILICFWLNHYTMVSPACHFSITNNEKSLKSRTSNLWSRGQWYWVSLTMRAASLDAPTDVRYGFPQENENGDIGRHLDSLIYSFFFRSF